MFLSLTKGNKFASGKIFFSTRIYNCKMMFSYLLKMNFVGINLKNKLKLLNN